MAVVMVYTLKIDDVEKKRELVKGITDVVEKVYNMPRDVIRVIIKEDPPENVGIGGTLAILDRMNASK